jgi:hypothetical protein
VGSGDRALLLQSRYYDPKIGLSQRTIRFLGESTSTDTWQQSVNRTDLDVDACCSSGGWEATLRAERCVNKFLLNPGFAASTIATQAATRQCGMGVGQMTNKFAGATASTYAARSGLLNIHNALQIARAGAATGAAASAAATGAAAAGAVVGSGVVLGCALACSIDACTY